MTGENPDTVIAAVLESKKYRNLAPDLIRYVTEKELGRCRKIKETVKAVKNKLHQVAGIYRSGAHYAEWLAKLAACRDNRPEFMACCLEIMQYHTSTRERLPVLADFYRQLFDLLPGVHSVIDIGCGLNPLALAWMPGAEHITYYALDIYRDLADFLERFFELAGSNGFAGYSDLLHSCPRQAADAAFLFKMLPVLEQEKPGRSLELLDELKVQYLVVTFPVRSVGGYAKGMEQHYSSRFTKWLVQKNLSYTKIRFPLELVFVVNRGADLALFPAG